LVLGGNSGLRIGSLLVLELAGFLDRYRGIVGLKDDKSPRFAGNPYLVSEFTRWRSGQQLHGSIFRETPLGAFLDRGHTLRRGEIQFLSQGLTVGNL